MNAEARKTLPDWLPYVVGALFVVLFTGLGGWQISRGLDKRAEQQLFSDDSGFAAWFDGMTVRPYQGLRVTGRPIGDQQFLLENIILNGRIGHYVLTPLETADDEPLLMINRGWIEKTDDTIDPDQIAITDTRTTVHGKAGSLPRAGFKMGEAVLPGSPWPKRAVYPVTEDLERELGRDVQPFVLLMDPEDDAGFTRQWKLAGMGPGRHFGYALQWFAMAAVLSGLLVWNYRRGRFESD